MIQETILNDNINIDQRLASLPLTLTAFEIDKQYHVRNFGVAGITLFTPHRYPLTYWRITYIIDRKFPGQQQELLKGITCYDKSIGRYTMPCLLDNTNLIYLFKRSIASI